MFCHSLLAWRVSAEKSADKFMGIPLYVISYFSLSAFNIFSLNLLFVHLIDMCFFLGFVLYETLCFLDMGGHLLPHVREVFNYNLFKCFLKPFSFSSSGTPTIWIVGSFNVVPEVSETVLNFFHSFLFVLFLGSYFHSSIFQLTNWFFWFCYCYWFLLMDFSFHLLYCSPLFSPLGLLGLC